MSTILIALLTTFLVGLMLIATPGRSFCIRNIIIQHRTAIPSRAIAVRQHSPLFTTTTGSKPAISGASLAGTTTTNKAMTAASIITNYASGDDAVKTTTMKRNTRAKMVTDLEACGKRLLQGDLVAFPTETVYGLGCHALDVEAVAKVFTAKERPLTDPLIVHVLTAAEAFALWNEKNENSVEGSILAKLCRDFWPGPLTLVAKADRTVVPDTIMANTGYCACRSPSHPTARALLQASQCPIAAPSANKFGHVSPTTALHVWDDLQHENVWILHADAEQQESSTSSLCCDVGVESTVAKLEMVESSGRGILTVLRQGAVSIHDLEQSLSGHPVDVRANLKQATTEDVAHVAPGQTIRHYSPMIPSFILSERCIQSMNEADAQKYLDRAVIIDYGKKLAQWQSLAFAYRDLTPSGDSVQAAQQVFEVLRWAEQIEGSSFILFPELPFSTDDALALAVKDRLTRAASGVIVDSLQQAVPNQQQ